MFSILTRAFSFMLIILMGILMRSTGFIHEQAGNVIKKVVINITLPAIIIVNFSSIESLGAQMILLTILGLFLNVIMIILGAILTHHRAKSTQALYMLCLPAYNIGAFCLPFVQSFLPVLGSVTACMFDVGNSIMCTGGTYAFVSEYTAESKNGLNIKAIFKRIVTSPPLMTYVVMFLLSTLQIKLPEIILTLVDPMAKANTFLSMLMLGLLFHFELKSAYLKEIGKIIGIRYIFAILCALIFYFLLPFDLIIRQTLVLLCFAPISAVAPAYTGMCGGDEGMASCANSISIICSLITITCLLAVLGLK